MKDLIKLTYDDNLEAKEEIENNKFDLFVNDSKVLPEHWQKIITPWTNVMVKLNSQKNATEDESDGKSHGSDAGKLDNGDELSPWVNVYGPKVTYRIDYFITEPFLDKPGRFVFTKTYDNPVQIDTLQCGDGMVPVIEEITYVTFATNKALDRVDKIPKKGLQVDIGDEVSEKKLHVRSTLLLNALRSIAKYTANPPTGSENEALMDGIFPYPFKDLFYHRQDLLQFKNGTTGPRANHTAEYNMECDRHIDILLEYLDNEPTIQIKSLEAKWNKKIPTTTFAEFWLLLKPGTDVYVLENGQLNAYVVESVTGGVERKPW
jgi:hypothetical protein